jgi:membrane fusion protein, multidrug efflux system
MLKLETAPVLAFALLAVVGCGAKGQEGGDRRSEPVPVIMGESSTKDVRLQVQTIGAIEALSTVEVISQVTGLVLDAHFREGEMVKRGQLLFSIDTRSYSSTLAAARAELEKNRALAVHSDGEATRQEQLFEQGLSTAQELSQAKATAAANKAAVLANQADVGSASLNVQFAQIRSPIEGRTGTLYVYPGNVVKANEPRPLVVIRSLEPIAARFSVSEQDLPVIQHRMKEGALEVTVTPRGAEAKSVTGRLTFIENSVDAATGTVAMKAQFANAEHLLWPGQFVDVRVQIGVESSVVVVPEAAVQTGQVGTYVYVVGSDGKAHRKKVEIRRTTEGLSVVASGLGAGERVVLDGQLRLREGTPIVAKPSPLSSAAGSASSSPTPSSGAQP